MALALALARRLLQAPRPRPSQPSVILGSAPPCSRASSAHPSSTYCATSLPYPGLYSLRAPLPRRRVAMDCTRQARSHSHGPGPHHHHHHHHHDNSYLVSANKNDPGVRITRIGLLSNLCMAIAKFVGGWAFNSRAMIADAWHSIADLASDILTLATVSWSLKPPTDRFPQGYGKIESLGALGVSGMLLAGGAYMGCESAVSLLSHFSPDFAHEITEHFGHGHSHSHANLGIPSLHAAWLAGGTILVKEWLYQATMKIARQRKSSVLASNAVHHRIDSLTGMVTLVAIVGANVLEDAAWLDPVGGLLISIMVVNAGLSNTTSALQELADKSIDDDIKQAVGGHARDALADLSQGHQAELRDVTGVKSGQNYLVDLEMAVPRSWTVDEARQLEEAVRTRIGARVRGARRVRVRFVPDEAPADKKFDEFISGSVSPPPVAEDDDDGHDRAGSDRDATRHSHKQ